MLKQLYNQYNEAVKELKDEWDIEVQLLLIEK